MRKEVQVAKEWPTVEMFPKGEGVPRPSQIVARAPPLENSATGSNFLFGAPKVALLLHILHTLVMVERVQIKGHRS